MYDHVEIDFVILIGLLHLELLLPVVIDAHISFDPVLLVLIVISKAAFLARE